MKFIKLEQKGARSMQKIKVKQNFFGQFLLFVSNIPFVNEKKNLILTVFLLFCLNNSAYFCTQKS